MFSIPGLITCWPVLTEAAYLLRHERVAIRALFAMIRNGALQVAELDDAAAGFIGDFLEQYANINPQVADAALMFLAERDHSARIFTLDRRDFLMYPFRNRDAPQLIPERLKA
jgi:uncharacterized protein